VPEGELGLDHCEHAPGLRIEYNDRSVAFAERGSRGRFETLVQIVRGWRRRFVSADLLGPETATSQCKRKTQGNTRYSSESQDRA
jgi:hypothetical protein